MRKSVWLVAAVVLLGVGNGSARADILFNFENLGLTTNTTSVSQTVGGITATVTRLDGNSFSVENLGGSVSNFGSRTIGNFNGPETNPGATILVNFSAAVSGTGISFGDFDVDDDGTVTLKAFTGANGGGSTVGSSSVLYPANLDFGTQGNAAIRTLSVSGSGILSFEITSGGQFPGSLYFDNVTAAPSVVATPEPASLTMLGIGIAGAAGYGWNRRKQRRT